MLSLWETVWTVPETRFVGLFDRSVGIAFGQNALQNPKSAIEFYTKANKRDGEPSCMQEAI